MTHTEALALIFQGRKDTLFYSDEYRALKRQIGTGRYIALHAFCRQEGAKDIKDWLIRQNRYCGIERDMRSVEDVSLDWNGTIEGIAARIFEIYPLIGEAILPEDVSTKLLARAQQIFDAILNAGKRELTPAERDVITLAIVQHIKRRGTRGDEAMDRKFWEYIYGQFGFKREDDGDATTQRLYNVLRDAVRGAFRQHKRFFSTDENTQRYYTSLMLHALSPVQSMESLFEILLFFYIKDLDFSYSPGDPAFAALVKCVATRWDRDIVQEEELRVRSNVMASGLRALFTERPDFMRGYCESIVKRIDVLVRGIEDSKLWRDCESDRMLKRWYAKKDARERSALLRNRSRDGMRTRIATGEDNIRIRYLFEDRRVCLDVPSIRLEEKRDAYPEIVIYQGDRAVWNREMEVYGRLSWTTRQMQIALQDTQMDFCAPLDIEVSIRYGDEEILGRDAKLHRQFIVFQEGGREVSAQSDAKGVHYIFASEAAPIETGEAAPEWMDHPGQLMRAYVDENSSICVGGEELFLSRERQGELRCYPSIARAANLHGKYEGEEFPIYPGAFSLDIRLPEGKRSLHYRLELDGVHAPLVKYCPDGADRFAIQMPAAPAKLHTLQISEVATGRIVNRFRYSVLPGVRAKMDSALVYDENTPVSITVAYNGCTLSACGYPAEGTDVIALSPEHLVYELEVELPIVRGRMGEQNLFSLPPLFWRGDISDATFVKLSCPEGWICRLFLGDSEVPQNSVDGSFELGNFLRSLRDREGDAELALSMRSSQGEQDVRPLTRIAFRERFTESPVAVEDGKLMWRPEGKYVGGKADEFLLSIDVPAEGSPYEYVRSMEDAEVDRRFGEEFSYGMFPYRVSRRRRTLFSAKGEQIVYEGELILGEPEQWRYEERCLYLTRARCWDIHQKRMVVLDMSEGAGCLTDFRYLGRGMYAGEETECPMYEAWLSFYNRARQQWQFFNDRKSEGFELINPVRVWIVNDQMLVLNTVEVGEPVLVDQQYNSIVNRRLNLPPSVERRRMLLPDYFEYREE